jgi:hypothetical protein
VKNGHNSVRTDGGVRIEGFGGVHTVGGTVTSEAAETIIPAVNQNDHHGHVMESPLENQLLSVIKT